MADSAITQPAGPLVLIVDDDEDTRDLCATLLGLSGFQTAEAANGVEALSAARALAPACILMDLSLPGIDGREVARLLRDDARTRAIPVLAVSGQSIAESDVQEDAALFAGVVTKPWLPETLLGAVRLLLRQR